MQENTYSGESQMESVSALMHFALLQTYTHNNIVFYAKQLRFISSSMTNELITDRLSYSPMKIRRKIEAITAEKCVFFSTSKL